MSQIQHFCLCNAYSTGFRIINSSITGYRNIKLHNSIINQHIDMISEGSCDSKDWSNG